MKRPFRSIYWGLFLLILAFGFLSCANMSERMIYTDKQLVLKKVEEYSLMTFSLILNDDADYNTSLICKDLRPQYENQLQVLRDAFRSEHPEYQKYKLDASGLKYQRLRRRGDRFTVKVKGPIHFRLNGISQFESEEFHYLGLQKRGKWQICHIALDVNDLYASGY